MSHEETPTHCRVGTVLGVGIGLGMAVGFAVGSFVALRLGREAVDSVKGAFGRLAGRSNQVNFELLLQ